MCCSSYISSGRLCSWRRIPTPHSCKAAACCLMQLPPGAGLHAGRSGTASADEDDEEGAAAPNSRGRHHKKQGRRARGPILPLLLLLLQLLFLLLLLLLHCVIINLVLLLWLLQHVCSYCCCFWGRLSRASTTGWGWSSDTRDSPEGRKPLNLLPAVQKA